MFEDPGPSPPRPFFVSEHYIAETPRPREAEPTRRDHDNNNYGGDAAMIQESLKQQRRQRMMMMNLGGSGMSNFEDQSAVVVMPAPMPFGTPQL